MSEVKRAALPSTVEKHSVSIPVNISEQIRSRVGSRGFSAYVSRAVTRQLQRDALDDVLARMEELHGPVDEAEVATLMGKLTE